MFPRTTAILSILSFFILLACGGSSTESSNFTAIEEIDVIDEMSAELANSAATLSVRDPSTLPRLGTAGFSGVLGFSLANGEAYDGLLELTADFSTDRLSGSVTDIVNLDNETVGGTLTISNGRINRTVDVSEFYVFAAPLRGLLTDKESRIGVDGFIVGQFLGNTQQFVTGEVRGDVFFDGATVSIIDSGFVADCDGLPEECRARLNLRPQPVDENRLAILSARHRALDEAIESASVIDPRERTISGNAEYSGVAILQTRTQANSLTGDLAISVDFEDNTFEGSITDVLNQDAHTLDGALQFSNGRAFVDNTPDPDLYGYLNGTLRDANSVEYVVDASLEASLVGNGERYFNGFALGTLTIDGETNELDFRQSKLLAELE